MRTTTYLTRVPVFVFALAAACLAQTDQQAAPASPEWSVGAVDFSGLVDEPSNATGLQLDFGEFVSGRRGNRNPE